MAAPATGTGDLRDPREPIVHARFFCAASNGMLPSTTRRDKWREIRSRPATRSRRRRRARPRREQRIEAGEQIHRLMRLPSTIRPLSRQLRDTELGREFASTPSVRLVPPREQAHERQVRKFAMGSFAGDSISSVEAPVS